MTMLKSGGNGIRIVMVVRWIIPLQEAEITIE